MIIKTTKKKKNTLQLHCNYYIFCNFAVAKLRHGGGNALFPNELIKNLISINKSFYNN